MSKKKLSRTGVQSTTRLAAQNSKTRVKPRSVSSSIDRGAADHNASSHRTHHLDTREELLRAARRVFAIKGYEGTTVKDIADAAQMNVSLISYHFGGKENLYRTSLESFGRNRAEAFDRILQTPRSREDFCLRARLFAEDLFAMQLQDPEGCKMVHRCLDVLDPISEEVFKQVLAKLYFSFVEFIEQAKKNRIVKRDSDSEIITNLMLGGLFHVVRSQELARLLGARSIENQEFRNALIDQWISIFKNSLFNSEKPA